MNPHRYAIPRLKQVEQLVAEAYTNEEIGRKLALATKSVKNMVSELLVENDARNRTELALIVHHIIPAAKVERLSLFEIVEHAHPVQWDDS